VKLKIKDVDLSTGGPLIVILNEEDAQELDLHALDRIVIKKRKKEVVATINIAENGKNIRRGEIGLFEEVLKKIKGKNKQVVKIRIAKRPYSIQYIKEKLDGKKLSPSKINEIIKDIIKNKLSEVELTYFVSACYKKNLSTDEIIALTKAICESGNRLKLRKKLIVDKHSIGGVPGNRTTMIMIPILAAAGLTIPKTSSRAITSPAGTADTMEVLANVSLPLKKIKKVVEKTKACMIWGGTLELASADDKLIKIEYPLSLDPRGILLASVLSKNIAVGSKFILIDIPIGESAKIKNRKEALELKKQFIKLGRKLGIKIKVILTNGSQPIGNGIGPMLEARDVLWILQRDPRRPIDLEKKSIYMADLILKMTGSNKKAKEILESGKAYEKMKEIIRMQGKKKIDFNLARNKFIIKANKNGVIKKINNKVIAKIARIAGAPKDKKAGIYLDVHKGDKIKKNDFLFTIFAKNKDKLEHAIEIYKRMKVFEIKS